MLASAHMTVWVCIGTTSRHKRTLALWCDSKAFVAKANDCIYSPLVRGVWSEHCLWWPRNISFPIKILQVQQLTSRYAKEDGVPNCHTTREKHKL